VSTERDEDDDDALTSTWYAFRPGFLFVAFMMTKILSRRAEVGDRMEFFEFLEELAITGATRIAYAEQFMFKHRASSLDSYGANRLCSALEICSSAPKDANRSRRSCPWIWPPCQRWSA
jgi:hypothetical protein